MAETVEAGTRKPAADGRGHAFRALRHRDFRLFLGGQVVSLTGTWMQTVAQMWLVYRLTHSTVLMGLLGFFLQIPVLLLGPVAGVFADRHSRRRLVIVAQMAMMIQALLLAWLTMSGRVTVTQVLVLAAVSGILSAFDIPARQSLFVHLVGTEDLSNAIALNSTTFNAARLVGPTIGGFFVAAFGEGVCFLVNAVTFLAVLGSLAAMRAEEPRREMLVPAMTRIKEGLGYCWRVRRLRVLLAATGLVNLAVAPLVVLTPVFADEVYHRGSFGLGLLTGAMGFGAVFGTLVMARRTQTAGLGRMIVWSSATAGTGLVVFAWSNWFLLAMGTMVLVGFHVFRQLVATNTLIQTMIPDDYRGRVMGSYSMMVVGTVPVGNLIAGWAAAQVGIRATVVCGGLIAAAAAVLCREIRLEQEERITP